MAGQSILTFASEAIKLVYGDLHEQLRDKNPALQLIEASSAHITRNGREVIFDTHIGRNQGIGARDMGDAAAHLIPRDVVARGLGGRRGD